jgi:hypothetical protein
MRKTRDIRDQEKREDQKIAAQKYGLQEEALSFVSTWDAGDEYLYLWNVTDPKSKLFESTVSGKTWTN